MPATAGAKPANPENNANPQDILPVKENIGSLVAASGPLISSPGLWALQSLPVLAFVGALVWRKRTDSLANICSRKGSDYRKVLASNAKALGMTIEKYREEVLVPNFLTSPRAAEVVETADVAPGSPKAPAAAPAKQEATK